MLLHRDAIDTDARTHLARVGEVFAVFDAQDSGNVSYGVEVDGQRFFVKTAGHPGNRTARLDHSRRVAALRNAARVARSCSHPVLATFRGVVESPEGPLLVYDWVDGEQLGDAWRSPGSAFQRLRARDVPTICGVVERILAVHRALADCGWIAVDLYFGSLLYDATSDRLTLVDVDLYAPGPFRNSMGRMFGSSSLMAPEEFERGSRIDEATTGFTIGRMAQWLLADGTSDPGAFRAGPELFEVVEQACRPAREARFSSIAALHDAWRARAPETATLGAAAGNARAAASAPISEDSP